MIDYATCRRLLAEERLPAAFVDLDAVDRNVDVVLAALGDRPITVRVASKSVRTPALLRHLLGRDPRFRGVMCYTAPEAEFLYGQGFDDLLVAYPLVDRRDAEALARMTVQGADVTAMVDDVGQIPVLGAAGAQLGVEVRVCLDVDASWRPLGGAAHIGVRRSPLRDVEGARRVAKVVADTAGVRLVGVMSYEAQVAGLRDVNPGNRLLDPALRVIKSRSVRLAASRRAQVVDALRADGHAITLVNGGGTGSVASTSRDPSVTEVTAGSGFLCPHLFDGYHGLPLVPAAFFALPVVRRSDPGFVTCAGGGFVASGSAGPDRLPVVFAPDGVRPVDLEGFGEVQTPFTVPAGLDLALGDPIVCRHAKAGELAEHFEHYLLVRGGSVVGRALTYRGLGATFR